MRLLPAGPRAVLVELDSLDAVLALDRTLRQLRQAKVPAWRGVVDIVPTATALLITVNTATDLVAVRDAVTALPKLAPGAAAMGPILELPVTYDGPDLPTVAELTGLGINGVIAAHTGRQWVAAFAGFAPGFAYLTDGDPALGVPRRAEPRTRVPAGSVALAGNFSGIYPRASPGGWQLIGSTSLTLWDPSREQPALLMPGTRVRFAVA